MTQAQAKTEAMDTGRLMAQYLQVRQTSTELATPLAVEDMVIQSMPDASPVRWHLAHTTWFFEHFLLAPRTAGYEPFNESWNFLFNSYYYSVGDMHKRPQRGLLSRPTVAEVLAYRDHVDTGMADLLLHGETDDELIFLLQLGLSHEQQHQELILTDIKHALSLNPLKPAYRSDLVLPEASDSSLRFHAFDGGIEMIGTDQSDFCFDHETPRHRILLNPFQLASRPVSNDEFRAFIQDGGYRRPELWLSDGWARVQNDNWTRPMYWSESLETEYSLLGEIELHPYRSVCHVSYYEADAFARWSGARLPSEMEWESVAADRPVAGNLLDQRNFHPLGAEDGVDISQLFGDTWEWTQSSYAAYPGFKPLAGSLGEYNGKFMCSQMVLRGGSCASAGSHIRATYRNFFYPDARWQFSGIRLAKDS